jgi:OOP family OmpA-OmpF porin
MNGSKLWKSLAIAAGVVMAAPVAAQALDDQPHFYAGGTFGRNDQAEAAWRAFGGWQANRWLGAEFGYHDLGRLTIGGVTVDSSAWEFVGVGRVPIVDRLAAYGKLGMYLGRSHGSGFNENNTDLTYGLGVEYGVTRQIALRGEWQRYTDLGGGGFGGKTDLDVTSIGVVYRFH